MDQLSDILHSHVASGEDTADKVLGAAFAVISKNGILYSGSAGRVGFDVNSSDFSDDSFTWVASMTKIITTTCIMQIVEKGLIGLDDDVRDLAPELGKMQILRGFQADDTPILEVNTKPITLRIMLTHTLGLGYDLADPDLVKWSKVTGRTANCQSWTREGFNTPIKFAPGEGWYYGTAIDWAGLVLEKVTGQTLGAYMQQHILDPQKMKDTVFRPEKLQQATERTVEYTYREGPALKPGPVPTPKEPEIDSGGAGLFSTLGDYIKFFHGFLQGKYLKEETVAQMFTPQLNEAQSGMLEHISYNMGIQDAFAPEFPKGLKLNHGISGVMNMEDVPGKRRKGSIMWSGMCNSHWWMDRESGIAGCLIVNVQPHGDPVVKTLLDELEQTVYAELVGK